MALLCSLLLALTLAGCADLGQGAGGRGGDRAGDRADRAGDGNRDRDRSRDRGGDRVRDRGSDRGGDAGQGRRDASAPAERPAARRVDAGFGRAVAMLRRAPERGEGYDRDAFVHWTDADRDGCDTRDEVLLAEAVRRPRVGDGCDLLGGRWVSPYDGESTRDPSTFDVDHLVPLADAWASGARRWSATRREAFANDLGDRRSLVAVTASSNRSKSDQDPSTWQPERQRCRYLRDWTAVKLRWDLTADRAEARTLTRRARACGGRVTVRTVRADDATTPGRDRTDPSPDPSADPSADPRFDTCTDAGAAGYGDYRSGDPEYPWYDDADGDGRVCES